ncbi:MAG: aldehyde:ferredoxin oxidoreductase [Clostridia bacterium]|nr:aldehyde:ferredoxin oxidoreductase [Clostridia bacterium]
MSFFPDANILHVDLNQLKIIRKTIPGETYSLYPGGGALALYLILQGMGAGVDPLGPENMLVFAVSPLTGLPVSGQSRMVVSTRSPLTGAIGESQGGGFFPAALKGNGWDAVVFTGRAPKPVYLEIKGSEARLRPAEHLWGRVTGEAEDLIREELGTKNIEIAQIGPAGENLVRFACIINRCSRANGRTGCGAVMGSKNLKAVVVHKSKPRMPVDPVEFRYLTRNISKRINENSIVYSLKKFGTAGNIKDNHEAGFLATRNFTSGWFPEGAENLSGDNIAATILKKTDTCYACSVRCKRVVAIPGKVDSRYGGPEYETCAAMGSYCGIGSLEAVAMANQLCNMYGLDTISCGATIAFAMECYERGILTSADTGGMAPKFGDAAVMLKLIEMIAKREGIGDLLAEGSLRAARKIGKEAEYLSLTLKGLEIPAHMPQFKPAVGLIYAVNPYGADHQSSEHDTVLTLPPDSVEGERLARIGFRKSYDNPLELDADKVRFAFLTQCFYSLTDTLCLCQFVWGPSWQLYGPEELLVFCRSGIGWETTMEDLMRIGERHINMMRYFNAREGFNKEQDSLPKRFFQPLPDGPSKGVKIEEDKFKEAVGQYYQLAGWDPTTGNPTAAKLKELSLDWLLE